MTEISLDEYYDAVVIDTDGEKVGGVGQVFLDEETGEPSWVTVRTGLFGLKESFVPLVDARLEDGQLHVAFKKDFIKDAPRQDPEAPMTVAEEDGLQAYYGTEDEPEKIAAAMGITVEELQARQAQDASPAEVSPDEPVRTADLDEEPVDQEAAPDDATGGQPIIEEDVPADEVPEDSDYPQNPDAQNPDAQNPRADVEEIRQDDGDGLPEGIEPGEHREHVEPEKHVYRHQTDFADEADQDLVEEGERLQEEDRFH